MADNKPEVAVIMGSASDWETMKHACEMLDQFEVPYVKQVISAHRTPELMAEFAHGARVNGLKVIIAGADKAAKATRELIKVHNAAEAIEAPQEQANAYANEVIPAMDALRAEIDALECVVERDYWPVPTYNDILFYA